MFYTPSFRFSLILASVSRVAEPEGVVLTAEPEVVFEPEAVFEPRGIFGPEVAFEPEVAFVVSADVAGLQASVDIAIAFAVLVPVSGVVVGADSSGRPKFRA